MLSIDTCNGLPDFIGDGFCDDANNNQECNFDAGDCCYNVLTDFCLECNCYFGMSLRIISN